MRSLTKHLFNAFSTQVHRHFQALAVSLCFGPMAWTQSPTELEHVWERDPKLNVRWVVNVPRRTPKLNLDHFDSASVLTRFEAARAALELSSLDVAPSSQVLERILIALELGESHLRTRQMLISAAAALLDPKNAQRLWAFAEKDAESRVIIEDSLIRIQSPVALEYWRSVLQSNSSPPNKVALALDGIAACGQASDSDLLRSYIKKSKGSSPLLMRAAKALGQVSTSGQLDLAQQLIESQYEQRFYLAALVLTRHQGEETASTLRSILKQGSSIAKHHAFKTLIKIDQISARQFADSLAADNDQEIRQTVVSFLQTFKDRSSFLLLSKRLADEIPTIRRQVRKELLLRSEAPEFRSLVDKIISQAIAAPQFEAAEQAVILIVELSDKTRENDLLKLLEHPKPEVNIRAAWALSLLVNDPKILEAMLKHAQGWTDQVMSPSAPIPRLETDEQRIAFLLEAFGSQQFQEADALLRLYIPKADGLKRLPSRTRLSGIWAIGKLYTNRPDESIRMQLEERVNDMAPVIPELLEIRFVSAIALGRMRDKAASETLSKYLVEPGDTLHEACSWSLSQFESP